MFKIPFRKLVPSVDIKLGILYSPYKIFLYKAEVFVSSKGR